MSNKFQAWRTARMLVLFACACLMVGTMCAGYAVAQRAPRHKRQTTRHKRQVRRARNKVESKSTVRNSDKLSELSTVSTEPLTATGTEPFSAIAREVKSGNSTSLQFRGTELDRQAKGTAQVALRGLKLFVRVRASNLPLPANFNQQYYLLWVDLPNYGQKLLLGDLPLVRTRRKKGRGGSDTAYYYAALPEGAVFGGLMLTAEPKRFLPVPTEPLHLLLAALPPKKDTGKLVATSTPAIPDANASSSSKEAREQSKTPLSTPQH